MAEFDNPAGRLHELLRRFGEQQGTILEAWAAVFEVPAEAVPHFLGHVASLVDDVRLAAEETKVGAFERIGAHLDALSESLFTTQRAFNSAAADVRPNGTAMEALWMFSAYLHKTAPEGAIPEDDELEELKESIRDLIGTISEADVPPEIRRPLLQRLNEMLEALEHLAIGGPDAVRRAAEALAASAVIYAENVTDTTTAGKIVSVAKKAWAVFSIGTVLATAPLGWDHLLHPNELLAPTTVQLLNAGPQHREQAHDAEHGHDADSAADSEQR